jgi:hypothetical protein
VSRLPALIARNATVGWVWGDGRAAAIGASTAAPPHGVLSGR